MHGVASAGVGEAKIEDGFCTLASAGATDGDAGCGILAEVLPGVGETLNAEVSEDGVIER
jgi:hypothetical protein